MVFLPPVPCAAPSVWVGAMEIYVPGLLSVSWFPLPSIGMFTNQLKVPRPHLPLLAHVHPFPFQQIWWVMLLQSLTPPPKPPTLKFLPPPLSYSLFLTLPPEYHCFLEKTLVKQTKDSLRDQESEQFLRLGQCWAATETRTKKMRHSQRKASFWNSSIWPSSQKGGSLVRREAGVDVHSLAKFNCLVVEVCKLFL